MTLGGLVDRALAGPRAAGARAFAPAGQTRDAAGWQNWPPAWWWPAGPEAEAGGRDDGANTRGEVAPGAATRAHGGCSGLSNSGGLTPEPVGRLGAHGSREGGPSGCELGRGRRRSRAGGNMGTAKATGAWARRARCRAARGGVVARSTTSGGEGKRRPRASPWVAEDGATGVEEGVGDDVAKKRQAGGEEEAGRRCSSERGSPARRRGRRGRRAARARRRRRGPAQVMRRGGGDGFGPDPDWIGGEGVGREERWGSAGGGAPMGSWVAPI